MFNDEKIVVTPSRKLIMERLYRIKKRMVLIPEEFQHTEFGPDIFKHIPKKEIEMYVLEIDWRDSEYFELTDKGFKQAEERIKTYKDIYDKL